MNAIKHLIKKIINKIGKWLVIFLSGNRIGRFFLDGMTQQVMSTTHHVHHNSEMFSFVVPNSLNHFRATTFCTKEPETLEWIDNIPKGAVLWDIGANVGLYSIYAAKKRGCEVYAFEPSVFNLELLARNIFLNKLTDRITIFPIPLSDKIKRSTLNMTTLDWGGALSTFEKNYGDDGKSMQKVFEFPVIGISMDELTQLNVPMPNFIKLDVDGIEQLILAAGHSVLRNISGILVEVNEDFEQQVEGVKISLSQAGLVLKEKRHGEMFENNARFGNTYNQIWIRPESLPIH